jgi:hypothetical protein
MGINEKSYYYWQRKVRASAYETYERTIQPERPQSSELTPSGFAEVIVSPVQEDSKSKSAISTVSQLHIALGSMRITADSNYPIATLSLLLKELIRE